LGGALHSDLLAVLKIALDQLKSFGINQIGLELLCIQPKFLSIAEEKSPQLSLFVGNTFPTVLSVKELITGVEFMKEGDILDVVSDASTETILYAEMPVKTQLKIVYTEPGLKGDTATNATKPAKLETGVEVRVPLFINEGEVIEVDTRDGSYLNRVK